MRRRLPLQTQRRPYAQYKSFLERLHRPTAVSNGNGELKFTDALCLPVEQAVILQLHSRGQCALLQMPVQHWYATVRPKTKFVRGLGIRLGQLRFILDRQVVRALSRHGGLLPLRLLPGRVNLADVE